MPVALIRADTLYAWRGPSLLVTTLRGECGESHPLSGFYYRETRVLRTLRIEINGDRPWLTEAALTAPERIDFSYVHPEITQPGGGGTGQSGDEEGIDAHGLPDRALDMQVSCTTAVRPREAPGYDTRGGGRLRRAPRPPKKSVVSNAASSGRVGRNRAPTRRR